MKKLITTLITVFITSAFIYAQSPDMMSYQAVVRDNNDDLVANQAVGMQISILQGSASGTAVYEETHTPTTNDNGLVSVVIGNGTVVSGDITTIDWENGPYYIKSETDPTGGTNYTLTGSSELLSVPYALHAKSSGGAIWTENGGDVYYNNGNVGIGTMTPETDAHVGGELFVDDQIRINPNDQALFGLSYLRFNEGDARMYHAKSDSSLNIKGFNLVDINDDLDGYDANLSVDGNIWSNGEIVANADGTQADSYFRFDDVGGPYIYYSGGFEDVSVVGAANGLRVVGDINATGTKNFKIDHPANPENEYLYHAAIESDQAYNKYSGNITTDENGEAVVNLPEYVQLVNKDFRYNLTVIGTFAQAIVGKEVADNKFVIRTDEPNVKVSWEITGVRNDPYMQENPFNAEVDKEGEEVGRYLTPKLYGKPENKRQDYQDPNKRQDYNVKEGPDGETSK